MPLRMRKLHDGFDSSLRQFSDDTAEWPYVILWFSFMQLLHGFFARYRRLPMRPSRANTSTILTWPRYEATHFVRATRLTDKMILGCRHGQTLLIAMMQEIGRQALHRRYRFDSMGSSPPSQDGYTDCCLRLHRPRHYRDMPACHYRRSRAATNWFTATRILIFSCREIYIESWLASL